MKVPYICGALTKFPSEIDPQEVKNLYSRFGDVFQRLIGVRAFVPHEHYDPIKFPHFEDTEITDAELGQIIHRTSILVVVNVAPTTGGGIEIAFAAMHKVPVVFFSPKEKISRIVTGTPKKFGVFQGIKYFSNFDEAILVLRDWISEYFQVRIPNHWDALII